MLLGRDQQEDAVVLLGFAELPGAKQLIGVRLDLLAAERGDRRHDQLNSRLALEIGEFALEIGALAGRKHLRLIHHPAGQSGKIRRGANGRRDERRDDGQSERGDEDAQP